MSIEMKVADSKSLLKQYIHLPEKIYKGDTRWVPPMYEDEWSFHNPQKNKALISCDGKPVGRIMGIIHHPYNQAHEEKTVRFFNLDCIHDQTVADVLIRYIEDWGKQKGMTKAIGPYGFSDKDPQGLQIEGLEHLPVLATPTNPQYLQTLVEHAGYKKVVDCVTYRIPVEQTIPPVYEKILERLQRNKSLKLINFTSRRQLKPYIVPVFRLVNETYSHLFGFVPMTEEEMEKFAAQYLPVLDPHFVKVISDLQNNVVAFVVAMPDMSIGIQKAGGKLFPFGFIHILNSMRKASQLDLLLGAVKPGYQGKGLTVMLGKALMDSAKKRKMTLMDSHLILETNSRMRSECERVNGKIYKRFRVYQKMIS